MDPIYRIGEYARYMGVSPDLLKHYERCGLIHAQTAENGYRYYPFHETTRLLECMRLRGYGFSLSEIDTLLRDSSYDEVQSRLDAQVEHIQRQILFQTLVIAEHRKLSSWMEMMRGRETHFTREEAGPILFLPQSHNRAFVHDPDTEAILPAWTAAMPIAKSARYFPHFLTDQALEDSMWGLAIAQSDAEALSLPVNRAVIRVEGGAQLHMHMHLTLQHTRTKPYYIPDVVRTLREHGANTAKPFLQFMLMTLNCSAQSHENCWRFQASLD